MENPKVVILMPCYNHEKFVKDAMDSIVEQTYTNWELLVVNDGSTDNTGKILEAYKDERIHYYDFKVNTGLTGVMHFLQDIAKESDAKYIAAMASDDMLDREKLEKQIKILEEHKEYKACFAWDKLIFSENNNDYGGNELYSHKENKSRYEWVFYFLTVANCINANSMLMEKDIFFELGKYNQHYRQLADYRLWIKLALKHPFYLIEQELTYYRRHDSNLSKPLVDVIVRTFNEQYKMFKEIMISMDKYTFRRTFYSELVYTNCNSEEELWAEKFIVLLNNSYKGNRVLNEQVAMDIYFDNSENEVFTEILKNKYDFTPKDFVYLTGNAGLIYGINIFTNEEILQQKDAEVFSPALALLNTVEKGELNIHKLSEFLYSTLSSVYKSTRYSGGEQLFQYIKQEIIKLRKTRLKKIKKRKILFVVAEISTRDFSKDIGKLVNKEVDEWHMAFVSTKEDYFKLEPHPHTKESLSHEGNCINLYNHDEHCLYFLRELFIEIDIIYYIDCLDQRYECNDMLEGYSLEIEKNAILSKELHEFMFQNDKKALQMMNSIEIY